MTIRKIYFDMDGVLADFSQGVRELCGMEPTPLNGKRDAQYDDLMWTEIAKVEHFYLELKQMPGAKSLFDTVYKGFKDRCEILTAIPNPKRNIVNAERDKIEWVKRNLSERVKVNVVQRTEKPKFCTGEDCVLIDDMQKNIRMWQELGGTGILFIDADQTLATIDDMNFQ